VLGRVVEFDGLDCPDGLIELIMQFHNLKASRLSMMTQRVWNEFAIHA
jgi:hypothetical protein